MRVEDAEHIVQRTVEEETKDIPNVIAGTALPDEVIGKPGYI